MEKDKHLMPSYFIVAFSVQLNTFNFWKNIKIILNVNYFCWLDFLLWCSCVYLQDAGDLLIYRGGPHVEKSFLRWGFFKSYQGFPAFRRVYELFSAQVKILI